MERTNFDGRPKKTELRLPLALAEIVNGMNKSQTTFKGINVKYQGHKKS